MRKQRIALLLCLALLLCGCTAKQEEAPVGSIIWESMPALNYGSMEYEQLKVEPWYCGRCEATGSGKWAETELGYYFMYDFALFYADKENLSNWVIVCNQPDCSHSWNWSHGQVECNGQVRGNSFLMIDGRLYTEESSDRYPELKLEDGSCNVIYSRAADGTDRRREYYMPGTVHHGGGASSSVLNYQYWLQSVNIFNPDGSYTLRLYCTTKDGEYLLAEYPMDENFGHIVTTYGITNEEIDGLPVMVSGPAGDEIFFTSIFGDNQSVAYRIRDGKLEAPDIMEYARQWRYLSGDTLRIFRKDDGLYDVDIRTGEEIKIADITGKNSVSVPLPNCMLSYGLDGTIELFDGQRWRPIQKPEPLRDVTVSLGCVASDRIFFLLNEKNKTSIYQVMLDCEELVMEYCGTLSKRPM